MEKHDTHEEKLKIYELGYLLVPTIAEEGVSAEVQTIKNAIESQGASFITEDFPKMKQLAYTMIQPVGSERRKFDKGYFGWIKFEVAPKALAEIKAGITKNGSILRSLITETVRENTLIGQKMIFRPAPGEKVPGEEGVKPVSEEELDKTIENLVVE